jgi:tRNA pseudouridine13 synthase
MSLPYLTTDFPGIGGVIKERPEDFFVQELPLYEPTGQGEHLYCEVEKVGLSTFDALHRLSAALNVHPRDIGYAGMKDAQAVTRQLFSIWGVEESALENLKIDGLTIRWAARHGNKLRLGHLKANRFAVKIRQVNPTDVVKLRPVIDLLQQRGMPNYFGDQRFGRRNDNDLLGAALVRGDEQEALNLLLGRPDPESDPSPVAEARRLFDAGDLEGSMKQWPRRSGMERRILARYIKTGNPSAGLRLVDSKLHRLWISALQSRLFNDVAARRIASLDQLMDGDLAWKHENGACFRVESAQAEQPRCNAFEISPTGPLLGYRLTLPEGEPLKIEQEVFAAAGLQPDQFRHVGRDRIKGARRPLRIRPEEVELAGGVDEHGAHITLAFTLPPGTFATVVLREIMKT